MCMKFDSSTGMCPCENWNFGTWFHDIAGVEYEVSYKPHVYTGWYRHKSGGQEHNYKTGETRPRTQY